MKYVSNRIWSILFLFLIYRKYIEKDYNLHEALDF